MSDTDSWSPVLVGRRSELATLRAAVAAPPSLVVVEGEAGIGKTRRVAELLTALDGTTRGLVGHCDGEIEGTPEARW